MKVQTLSGLQDKCIRNPYNEDSMLVRDYRTGELWVVKLNSEATKINTDAEDPYRVCVTGKCLFVFCGEKKAIIKYVSN